MSSTPVLYRTVEATPARPLPHNLVDGAIVIDVTPESGDMHELMGVEWQPLSCSTAGTWEHGCPDLDYPEPEQTKTIPRAGDTVTGDPVTVYGGYECSTIGHSFSEARERAQAAFSVAEIATLEDWVMHNVLAAQAVDVTPAAGAVNLAQAVALVESKLAERYTGVGIVHVPAGAAALFGAAHQIVQEGARYRTWLGNRLVFGAGYDSNVGPDGTPAPDGEAWIYATGPMVIRRGPVNTIPASEADAINTRINDLTVLVERTYVVGVECAVVASRTTLGCGCC